ncbi:superoxide dismutase family protein [Martelella sp. HB161492]|uniref:superoxide dismutase family protein n=1 Tax=Martelella sp. HB161492 TaxID=2720726 RepID=UPI001591F90D|nr:superoxide dismutase family protein [Martelella sp. HB161492]
MKKLLLALCLATSFHAVARAETPQASTDWMDIQTKLPTAHADFMSMSGETIGQARLIDTGSGVLILVDATGLEPGTWQAFHVHTVGTCDPDTGFKSAEGHFNPDNSEHGFLVDGGPHAGDMPNQYVPEDGHLRAQIFNPMISLDDAVTGVRGRALMFHEGADDYVSQPAGDAGGRMACAVIK